MANANRLNVKCLWEVVNKHFFITVTRCQIVSKAHKVRDHCGTMTKQIGLLLERRQIKGDNIANLISNNKIFLSIV